MKEEKKVKAKEIKEVLQKENIENIYFNFVDFFGKIFTKKVQKKEFFEKYGTQWYKGIVVEKSGINNCNKKEKFLIIPDVYSFKIISYNGNKIAMFFCNIKSNELDTRKLLKNAVEECWKLNVTPMMGTQIYHMPCGKEYKEDMTPDIANIAADKLFTARWFVQYLGINSSEINFKTPLVSTCPVHMSLWKGKRKEISKLSEEEREKQLSELGHDFIKGIVYFKKSVKGISKVCTNNNIINKEENTENLKTVKKNISENEKNKVISAKKRADVVFNGDTNYYLLFATLVYARVVWHKK